MHYIDVDKTHKEKARREMHKNSTSYIEQILEATPHETTVVSPLTSYEVHKISFQTFFVWTFKIFVGLLKIHYVIGIYNMR